jgi:hypothetical protein
MLAKIISQHDSRLDSAIRAARGLFLSSNNKPFKNARGSFYRTRANMPAKSGKND